MTYSRWNTFLNFCDVLEEDRSKLSMTKVAAWGSTLINFANLVYQFFQTHPDAVMLAATTVGQVVGAVKAEIRKRRP